MRKELRSCQALISNYIIKVKKRGVDWHRRQRVEQNTAPRMTPAALWSAYNKDDENPQRGKDDLLGPKQHGETGGTGQRARLDYCHAPCADVNSERMG